MYCVHFLWDRAIIGLDLKIWASKTWYTIPTSDFRMTSPVSQRPSGSMSTAASATSLPSVAMSVPSSVPHMSLPSALHMALSSSGSVSLPTAVDLSLPCASQVSLCSSVSSLPGFSSFLPGYKTLQSNSLKLVSTSKTPNDRSKSNMVESGTSVRASDPVTYTHGASLLSSAHSEAGAALNETVAATISTSKESSPGIFRPVGVLLKKTRPDMKASILPPSTHMACQSHGNSSAYMYHCTPPASQTPWNSNYNDGTYKDNDNDGTYKDSWTSRTTYDGWNCDSSVQNDSKSELYSNSQMYMDSKSQTSYGMYPFSQVYTVVSQDICGSGQETSKGRMMARASSGITFQDNSSPCCSTKTSPLHFYDSRNDIKSITFLNDSGDSSNCGAKSDPYTRNQGECVDGNVKSNAYASKTMECINNASVVTVRANENSLFMANPISTTSQTESEFSLHDVKMQLVEGPPLSEPAPPPPPPPPSPSPYSSHSALSCGGVADKQQPQPIPGDKVKPHPGLDMLSDVSLLVESLTSQASNVKDSDSQCLASDTIASSLMTCCSYPPLEDTDTTLCSPQATYVGSLPSDPDSTMTHIPAGQVDGSILPDDGLEYTAMHPPPVMDVCCTDIEALQEQYTLMLPPKKSTKFTRRALRMESLPLGSTGSSCKPRLFLKLHSNSTKNASEKSRHGKHRKNVDYQDQDKSRTKYEKKKRGRPKKLKDSVRNSVSSTEGNTHSQIIYEQTKVKRKKHKYQMQLSPQIECDTNAEESSHTKTNTKDSGSRNITGNSQDTENSLAPQLGPVYGCVPKHNGPHSHQASCGIETAVYRACESQKYQNKSDGLQTNEDIYEQMSLKVHFDPLVIAEEEVSSTQPHDNLTQSEDNTDISSGDYSQTKMSKRRRSHICVSCFSIPSSDDESLSPNSDISVSTSVESASFKYDSRKSSKKGRMKSGDAADKANLTCAVCSRTFSTTSNLARHQRVFHPSLFDSGTPIVELTLASPQLCKQPKHDCFPFPLKSANSSPSFPTTPVSVCPGPHSPIITALKLQSTPPSRNPRGSTSACPPVHDVKVKLESATNQQNSNTDQLQTGNLKVSKRRRFKHKAKKQDEDWVPPTQPSKNSRKSRFCVGPKKILTDRKADRPRQQTAASMKEGGLRPRQAVMISQRPQRTTSARYRPLQCVLNFRTKKRTRVNSTIPCPYCERLFSVMSNLKRHTKQQHQDVNVFACNVCSLKVNMRRKLNNHMRMHHAKTFPYACKECLARFKSEQEMSSHMRGHKIERFPCKDCNLIFYTKEHLEDHMANYHVTLQFNN